MGFRISLSSIDGVTHIHCFAKDGPTSRKFMGRSAEGIKIGMDRSDVERLVGSGAASVEVEYEGDVCVRMRAHAKPRLGDE